MATKKQEFRQFYGTSLKNEAQAKSDRPEQILGLIPCRYENINNGEKINTSQYSKHFIPASSGDNNTFLFEFPAVGVDQYYLYRVNGNCTYTQLVELVNGNFGVKIDVGNYSDYPTYGSYQIDWGLVYDTYGSGYYAFAVGAGEDDEMNDLFLNSPTFILSQLPQDGTVYIQVENNGDYANFLYNESTTIYTKDRYDLIRLDVADSCRYYGRFLPLPTESEETIVEFQDGSKRQGFTDDVLKYELQIFETTDEIAQRLFHYGLTNNTAAITDNNSDQPFIFQQIDVENSDTEAQETFPNHSLVHNITFTLRNALDQGFRRG